MGLSSRFTATSASPGWKGWTPCRTPPLCGTRCCIWTATTSPWSRVGIFIQDLLGLSIVDADTGEAYGTLTEVSFTGANDVYHMRMGGREILIPAIPQVVVETDTDGGVMRIRPIKGLLDDED